MLDEVLKAVSENCLRRRPVPVALRALWEAQVAGDSPIEAVAHGEVELVSAYDDEFFEGYDPDFCGEAVARAYQRMFRQIAFIGREADGGLIGYWVGDEAGPVEQAPIVVLDNEGQFHITAATLQDHFVQAAGDDPDAVAAIRRWFESRGIETRNSREAVWKSIEGLPDPNQLSWQYQREESSGGS